MKSVNIHKDKITTAFKALRNQGFFARQNFLCCQTCGCAAIPEGREKYVFYHAQDNAGLKEHGECYLTFGQTVEDGKQIVKALNEAGVYTDWPEDLNVRILISLNRGPLQPFERLIGSNEVLLKA